MPSHPIRVSFLSLGTFLAIGLPFCSAGRAESTVQRDGKSLTLGNEFMTLSFQNTEGRWPATQLVNKLAGRTLPIRSDDFSLGIDGRGPLRAADFTVKEIADERMPGGQRLVFHLEAAAPAVQLKIVYELGDRDFYVRRRLEMSVKDALPLRQVDAWLVGISGKAAHEGFGEPVFLEDTFWGLEFPASHNHYADGVVRLTQYPGRTIADRFTSKTAVAGVAQPGRVAERFQQYVDGFRVTPEETALFVNYNTWWTLMPPTEKNCLELVELFKQKLFEPHGESVDTFTLDDGWDDKNSLWAIRKDRFPDGFGPLVASLAKINARLGIWLSPSSGYSHAPWGSTHGYEGNSNAWFLCQSGPNYRRDIVKVVTDLAKRYDVAFFKFDGFSASCDATGHGHLPGPYAQEANVDAFIELLTAVRQVRPNIYLDPTCGIWLSPWWLRYADSLWGSVSGDYPDIIVPAPIIRDSATTTRDGVFRQRCREHPGFPPAAIEHLGIIVITPEKWEDNAMIVAGRGCRLLTLYINPKFFQNGDRDWAFLASLLKWVRHNARTLQQTKLILGDPFRREPYGYAHFRGPRGILALRNPFIEPRAVEVKLDESAGWSRGDSQGPEGSPASEGTFVARVVYPHHETLSPALRYGDTLSLVLQGYETAILHIEPVKAGVPVLLGARCQEIERAGNRIRYAVYGRPGEQMKVSLAGVTQVSKASLDDRALSPTTTQGRTGLSFALPGEAREGTLEPGALQVETSGAAWQLKGTCTAEVPPGVKAVVYVLCDPKGTVPGGLQCAAEVNGKPASVRVVERPAAQEQAHATHSWTWFAFDLPAGRNEVSVAIAPSKEGSAFIRGEAGWWLSFDLPLAKGVLTLEFPQPLPAASSEPLPLPIGEGWQRKLVAIDAPRTFRAGNRWPKLDRPSVYLDEAAPDDVSQDYGSLQRNRSVWEKEMIIAGRKFDHGLGAHANGRIVYDLTGGGFKSFRCMVGRDEHAGDGRVEFEVGLDGKNVFKSGPMTKAIAPKAVEIDVAGAAELELRSRDGGDGISGDHANWADAQLAR
jgi:hypothetical protein